MAALLGLFSIGGLSLFFARLLRKSSAFMPLFVISAGSVYFTLAGILNILPVAGWLWYILAVAGLAYVFVKERKAFARLLSPGFLFFIGAGVFFCVLFMLTQPMLTHWDEFTFWGTAAKVTSERNALYTVAQSNLIARSYPPGLPLHNYMVQFFSRGFSEYQFFSANALFYLACMAAVSPACGKNKKMQVLLLCALLFVPFFFETVYPAGRTATSYIFALADPALALCFGGVLCFGLFGMQDAEPNAARQRDGRYFLMLALQLCALTNIKDIGFALALLCLFVVAVDMLFDKKTDVRLFGLKGIKAALPACVLAGVCIVATYLLWAMHMNGATGANRFDLGNAQGEKSMFSLLLSAAGAFVGINPPEQFLAVRSGMWQALFDPARPVSLAGPVVYVLAFIVLLCFIAWFLSVTKQQRRRVLVFTLAGLVGFVLFYLFNIFTYSFVFSWEEGVALKEYARYIYPYLCGWFMGTAGMLVASGSDERLEAKLKYTPARVYTARLVSVCLCMLLVAMPVFYGKLSAGMSNFLHVSPSVYTQRNDVKKLLNMARAEGMSSEDVVYLISQDDDGSRFYILCYEMQETLLKTYNYYLDDNGGKHFAGTSSAGLSPADERVYGELPYPVECTPQDLAAYLEFFGATHILLDSVSPYILEDFAFMFEGGLPGWTADGWYNGGQRYYRIEWGANGTCRFIPTLTGGYST